MEKIIKIIYCPICKTDNIQPYAASMSGSYYCKKCGYVGTFVIEKEVKQ
jgi:transposase-like protein